MMQKIGRSHTGHSTHRSLAGCPTNAAVREAQKMLDSFRPTNSERALYRLTNVSSAAGAFESKVLPQQGLKPAFHV